MNRIILPVLLGLATIGFSEPAAVAGDEAEAPQEKVKPQPPPTSKADRPPRKVVLGTVVFGGGGDYPGLEAQLGALGGLKGPLK